MDLTPETVRFKPNLGDEVDLRIPRRLKKDSPSDSGVWANELAAVAVT